MSAVAASVSALPVCFLVKEKSLPSLPWADDLNRFGLRITRISENNYIFFKNRTPYLAAIVAAVRVDPVQLYTTKISRTIRFGHGAMYNPRGMSLVVL